MQNDIFQRTKLLLGEEVMDCLSQKRVILFGVGGVGSWCAESLIRSGIIHLTLVDSDRIAASNINRQLHATQETVGQVKTEVLKDRLLSINPLAQITALQRVYDPETASSFSLDTYDYILDAIDSLSNKIHLIQTATKTRAVFYSSMGAALKMDPTRIRTAEFWKVQGCPLAAALRRRLRKGESPSGKFLCVYSDELLQNRGTALQINPSEDSDPSNPDWNARKAQINGTLMHVTATFGLVLAGLVIRDILIKNEE